MCGALQPTLQPSMHSLEFHGLIGSSIVYQGHLQPKNKKCDTTCMGGRLAQSKACSSSRFKKPSSLLLRVHAAIRTIVLMVELLQDSTKEFANGVHFTITVRTKPDIDLGRVTVNTVHSSNLAAAPPLSVSMNSYCVNPVMQRPHQLAGR
ncbi:hypothetical protein M433DRAFT_372336 [Acidomyces richmondensis BFW]|nr:MAG: hypothetical protein FE78DRAFT_491213 [Acidomyces sp. 'richmondensis']KYG43117.1 hypothetical protein M433DRAFT_372336 [Acidomyces richmondensis BFW]